MNPRLTAIADRQGGPFTRAQALSCAVSDDQLQHLVSTGVLRRLRRGSYVERTRWAELDAVGRHLTLVRAVALALCPRVAFSHVSAAALHGIALWDADLSRVHVTRLDGGAPRRLAGVEHHVGVLDESDIVRPGGLPAVRPGRAVLEVAMSNGFEPGLVAADSALHQGLTQHAELGALLDEVRSWPGAGSVSLVVDHADGRAESVGESRARALCTAQDLPVPKLQENILDDAGSFVARVDFLFENERTTVEFDGRVKYQGTGDEARAAVLAEKYREDRLRELGYQVVRLTWADLTQPERTAQRLRAAFARSAAAASHPHARYRQSL